ncbi:winged helix-turn-helix domain-containing protein, partial [Mycobacterium avium]|uniref:winged helix-turn-helix domain-containing protein n=2 Tax=Mycobacterium TaxID=1763 RepID=UPI0015E0CE60
PRPAGAVTRAHLNRLISKIQVLQLDSVSVTVRAHYAPVFSRLGPYDREVLDRAAWGPRSSRLLVEYWAHEAALMAVEDWPLLRWRMRQYRHGRWGTHIVQANPRLADAVVAAVAELGPSTAGQIEAHLAAEPRRRKGAWWNRSDTKWVAEALFAAGVLTTATRVGFARHYDLVERVLPADVLARRVDDDEAIRELTLRAAGALGVGTEADIRDYFRLSAAQVKPAIAELVAAGDLERVEVAGWPAPAYLRAGRAVPRTDRGTALLCPFDPLIFFRPRVERLFEFHYRIEIYTPAAKRRYGYYVWPLLMDGRLAARVDLKADRAEGTLRVLGAFAEPQAPRPRVAAALAGELWSMASWLGLRGLSVVDRGDLAPALRAVA